MLRLVAHLSFPLLLGFCQALREIGNTSIPTG